MLSAMIATGEPAEAYPDAFRLLKWVVDAAKTVAEREAVIEEFDSLLGLDNVKNYLSSEGAGTLEHIAEDAELNEHYAAAIGGGSAVAYDLAA